MFSGAGVSTSTGIPDYRGPQGVWTLQEKGETPAEFSLENAQPSFGHRFVANLVEKGYCSGVVTTNIDNLFQKAGVEAVAELHGNCFREQCRDCKRVYVRSFDVTKMNGAPENHETSRSCDDCKGALLDTIVHFGEALSAEDFSKAQDWAKSAGIALVLGTSLRVAPANKLPSLCREVFIVNLQKTPLDSSSCVT